jgi:hypothetical protein
MRIYIQPDVVQWLPVAGWRLVWHCLAPPTHPEMPAWRSFYPIYTRCQADFALISFDIFYVASNSLWV